MRVNLLGPSYTVARAEPSPGQVEFGQPDVTVRVMASTVCESIVENNRKACMALSPGNPSRNYAGGDVSTSLQAVGSNPRSRRQRCMGEQVSAICYQLSLESTPRLSMCQVKNLTFTGQLHLDPPASR